ncbi:TetR/AcrR family transcriptional regulator [Actinospica robiniae]|uniref:TetR/AcrR family transcriptional regulator n=1 Tax=Actinospica robiniae TaxID=304901 RepID=UPI000428125C|nr:TetR/AcrR family transcriptional regulator [Actinospica robiniae]
MASLPRIKVDERREQFVRAAIEVMSREGLDRATTRRIAEQAGAPQAAMHYAFRDKNELLTAVIGAVTEQVEQILRDAVTPERGLAAAIADAVHAFWSFVVGDDGLQLMQYELMIYCRRTPGFEWLAAWQYTRYAACTEEVLRSALEHETEPPSVELPALVRFLVAAIDGLVIQYEVHHEAQQSQHDVENVISSAITMAGLGPRLGPALDSVD